ncbi:hypothetical protein D3C77_291770 [compost metagenome]
MSGNILNTIIGNVVYTNFGFIASNTHFVTVPLYAILRCENNIVYRMDKLLSVPDRVKAIIRRIFTR